MEKVLIVESEKCTGCRICELVCSFAKHGEYNPKKSLIRVLRNREMNVNIPVLAASCDLCGGDEKCVYSCPTKVLQFVEYYEAALLRKETRLPKFPAPLISRPNPGG